MRVQSRGGVLRSLRFLLAQILQVAWGLPQTMVGLAICLCTYRRETLRMYRSSVVVEWRKDAGLSLGMFVFVPHRAHTSLVVHEYGHCLQSLLLGPFYLPFIVLPSLLWAGIPAFERYRDHRGFSYYRFFTERWANLLAHAVAKEDPMGWY